MQAPTIVLLTGGADSTTLLHVVHARAPVVPVFVDYGQRAAHREHQAAERQCAALGLSLRRFDMGAVGAAFRAEQQAKLHIPLPHRNLVVLSLALSYAAQIEAAAIAIAVIRDDIDGYASASLKFLEAIRHLASALGTVAIETPLVGLDKRAVLAEGVRLGIDYGQTYSCMLGYERHCGRCTQCKKRRAAFAAAGMPEGPGFYLHDPEGPEADDAVAERSSGPQRG
ncbi:7-cyano-7-deazaguanine synthase [Sorangium sp. So ce1335]|uniref:7-cyano-7-deazaguanine synthase n=1 Tax=Sorangium sp. So ce1335 TaxID=3133335 RepID=UPI003F621EC3